LILSTAITLRRTKLYNLLDMTGSASPTGGMSSCTEIPVFWSDRFKGPAFTAELPPNTLSELTTGVNPLVLNVGEKLQV
jgi:hypothetical protein